ncbi:ParA family protein [Henriciella sp. AS95]|uniref:ParA family protein n=1 Tax=Henriciella sp. AS95 TaxID=3135782 RepID=UPI00317F6F43
MSASFIAVANLKGGVGKSTTTLMLADGMSYYFGANVLVVDFDPQANSSQMMLSERGVQMAFDQDKGVNQLMDQFAGGRPPNLADLILPNAVSLVELRKDEDRDDRRGWISTLPAHPSLRFTEMEVEERLYSSGMKPSQLASRLRDHLAEALEPVESLYDLILIDTPPYLSPLARSALMLADYFVTPTLADPVSIWGTKQFSDWISANVCTDIAAKNYVVVTRFKNTKYGRAAEQELREIYLADRKFGPTIPESVQVLQAMDRADVDSYNTMRGKYGSLRNDVKRLSESFAAFLATSNGAKMPELIRS